MADTFCRHGAGRGDTERGMASGKEGGIDRKETNGMKEDKNLHRNVLIRRYSANPKSGGGGVEKTDTAKH